MTNEVQEVCGLAILACDFAACPLLREWKWKEGKQFIYFRGEEIGSLLTVENYDYLKINRITKYNFYIPLSCKTLEQAAEEIITRELCRLALDELTKKVRQYEPGY